RLNEHGPLVEIRKVISHRECDVFVGVSSEDRLRYQISDASLLHHWNKIVLQVVLIIVITIWSNVDKVDDGQLRSAGALTRKTQIGSRADYKSANAVDEAACLCLPGWNTLRAQALFERAWTIELGQFAHRSHEHIFERISCRTCTLPNLPPL